MHPALKASTNRPHDLLIAVVLLVIGQLTFLAHIAIDGITPWHLRNWQHHCSNQTAPYKDTASQYGKAG
jgi:hypothetical protein